MTISLFNIISVVIVLALVAVLLGTWRRLKRSAREAEGFCSVNERGEKGLSDEGDIVGEEGSLP